MGIALSAKLPKIFRDMCSGRMSGDFISDRFGGERTRPLDDKELKSVPQVREVVCKKLRDNGPYQGVLTPEEEAEADDDIERAVYAMQKLKGIAPSRYARGTKRAMKKRPQPYRPVWGGAE